MSSKRQSVYAAIASRSPKGPRDQGHILSRLAFLKYLNYWKIAGLRPAIFSGPPGNFEA